MLIGAIADDFTGATDLALMLARGGMRTVQWIGVPEEPIETDGIDAIVIALKSRTIPPAEAVRLSLAAAGALQAVDTRQIFFKYCSTFDSTDEGNIGPVAEALAEALDVPITVACPAFPANGRTVFQGHLFVGDRLLSESPMKDHPLTPMRDSDLVAVLGRQVRGGVGLVPEGTIAAGAQSIRKALETLAASGKRFAILDAVSDADLGSIGAAIGDLKLVTGGSGIALGLPDHLRSKGLLPQSAEPAPLPFIAGPGILLAGSCSAMTRKQVAKAIAGGTPALKIDPLAVASGATTAATVLDWVLAQGKARPPLIFSSADPAEVARTQQSLGRDEAGAMIEHLLAALAKSLVRLGYRRFIVAGGETSGAVVEALGVKSLAIGPEIAPGVPWTATRETEPPLALALKSGNFGDEDFFQKAWAMLPESAS